VLRYQLPRLSFLSNAQKILSAVEARRRLQSFNLWFGKSKAQGRSSLGPQLLFEHQALVPTHIRAVAAPGGKQARIKRKFTCSAQTQVKIVIFQPRLFAPVLF